MTSLDAFKIIIERIGKGESLEGTYNEFLLIKNDLEVLEILKPRIYIEEGLYREDFQDDRLKFGKDFFDSIEQENIIKEWLEK